MMRAACLYETPQQFSDMMLNQVSQSMGVAVRMKLEDPLLLDIQMDPDDPGEKVQVSLHNVYHTYRANGDLNVAIDYLNGILHATNLTRRKDELWKLDPAYVFPAVRDERYVTEAGRDMYFLSDPCLPGLRIVFLEIKGACSKVINHEMLKQNPNLTEMKLREFAYRNLKKAGWQQPRLSLASSTCKSCTVDVYADYSHPVECQFLRPELAASHLPDRCVIAFTNRQYALVLRSFESMDTLYKARRLIEKSGFRDVVRRSVNLLPNPVSDRIYWMTKGRAVEVVL